MTPVEFLRAVWPASGIYCIATPYRTPEGEDVYAHKTFKDVESAAAFCLKQVNSTDLFFAVHTLKDHQVWDPHKLNRKNKTRGANSVRCHQNMRESRAFFFDIDVDKNDAAKYPDQLEAAAGLKEFCQRVGLPKPLIVSSGGGLHIYWIISEALPSDQWKEEEYKLRQLAVHYGFKIDTQRTTDISSVLRVVGTYNLKNRENPRVVKVLNPEPAQVTGTGEFIGLVNRAITTGGIELKPLPKFEAIDAGPLGVNTAREFNGPPVTIKALAYGCKQVQKLMETEGNVGEPIWYHCIIGLARFLEDGHRRVHQMSRKHPSYSEGECDNKIRQHENWKDAKTGRGLGPTTCATMAQFMGAEGCIGCPHLGKVKTPLQAARWHDPAPPPTVTEFVGLEQKQITIQIPPPPEPFIRKKDGTIGVHSEDEFGNKTYTMIFEHDLYPVRRVVNVQCATEQHVWHVTLPRAETKDFTLDADMLYDGRKFTQAISNQGIYPHRGNVTGLQEYMVEYIKQLQRMVDADSQSNHLGWTDDFDKFILPDKVMCVDGTIKLSQLSLGAQRSSVAVHKKGDAKLQAQLLDFYKDPAYVAHQFLILSSFAAPTFHATGNHGVIINASGESGASKSTSLYTAASIWGQPTLYAINGTNDGATIRGRNERVAVLANLPVCVDEITHMKPDDAINLAMNITQPGQRIRLEQSGVERASIGSFKSTMMLTTANNSLHGLLSINNAAATAASMRVFEVKFLITRVHTKAEADEFLHLLKENYGHLGEVFMAYVLKNQASVVRRIREKVRQIDKEADIQPSERYWSASIAVVLVAGEICNELGLCHYNVAYIHAWALNVQIPAMRGIVRSEYSDPLSILTDYFEQITNNMVVIDPMSSQVANGKNTYMARKPQGALLAHYDRAEQVCYVLKKGFKDHCSRIGANSLKILTDLHEVRGDGRIISSPLIKRTLGAGTDYAKGQSICFAVNMAHPEVSGIARAVTSSSEPETEAQPPALKVIT